MQVPKSFRLQVEGLTKEAHDRITAEKTRPLTDPVRHHHQLFQQSTIGPHSNQISLKGRNGN